ncbi:hypothetical protein BDZ89DRAFT_1064020 [Hymenopellis radicata]|nr:hypothetical protein BDZ89DRAFT_1064020 [Hymenopellis radicata]
MSLRRTHSFLSLSDLPNQQQSGTGGSIYITASKDLRSNIEKSIAASLAPITNPAPIRKSRSQSPSSSYSPPRTTYTATQSPTPTPSPSCSHIRARPRRFPREPDLHRLAIQRCMRATSEGQKILNMGPRLAVGILTATRELERMLQEGEMRDSSPSTDDIVMDNDWQVINH